VSKITSLAPWFGGKRTMAPAIVEEIGEHHSYWEPFCGSMAVLLAKPPSWTEVANDLHGDLINLARVIQSPTLGPKLYRALRRVLCSEALFRDALLSVRIDEVPDPAGRLDWHRAYQYFIVSWQGMNGVAGTSTFNTNFARRFSSLGGDPAVRWTGAVRSIPAWRKRLERVQVLSADGIELCEKIEDREGTVIYEVPPRLRRARPRPAGRGLAPIRADPGRRQLLCPPPARGPLSRLADPARRRGEEPGEPGPSRPGRSGRGSRGPARQRPRPRPESPARPA
jgi:DNA adenine methylase